MMQSENKNQREEQSIVNEHKSDSNTMKAAKITSIASILVAFVLGGFTIFSMYLANRNNIKAINLQNKINTEIAKFESDNRYELQKKDQLYQINQLKKAFTNTIEAIKAEKEASLSIQEKKSKKEKDELFNKSVRHLIININSIISEFDIILSILDNNRNKKFFDKLFLLNNKIQIKSAIEIIKAVTPV